MARSKKPDTKAQDEQMAAARLQQAQLDEEENRRRKRLLVAAAGVRAFKGSAMFRGAARNSTGRAPTPYVAPNPGTGARMAPGRGTGGSAGGSSGRGRKAN